LADAARSRSALQACQRFSAHHRRSGESRIALAGQRSSAGPHEAGGGFTQPQSLPSFGVTGLRSTTTDASCTQLAASGCTTSFGVRGAVMEPRHGGASTGLRAVCQLWADACDNPAASARLLARGHHFDLIASLIESDLGKEVLLLPKPSAMRAGAGTSDPHRCHLPKMDSPVEIDVSRSTEVSARS